MKHIEIVLYTQRVEIIADYGERRDCADQMIPRFIQSCGYLPVPVPNVSDLAREMALRLSPVGIMLTGGNSLQKYGGSAPERDETEKGILDTALKMNLPVYGFCRGMQVILDYYGARLQDVENHVAVNHKVSGVIGEYTVNSYHRQACFQVPDAIKVLAAAEDGVIEAISVKGRRIIGTMWHPERVSGFCMEDIKRVQQLFGKENS